MKVIFIRLFAVMLLPVLCSAGVTVPEGGTLVLSKDPIGSMGEKTVSPYGTLTRINIGGQPFTNALRCEVNGTAPTRWSVQFQFRSAKRIEKGEVLWARFQARALAAKTESGEGDLTVIFEKAGPPYNKSLMENVAVGREWREYVVAFKARDDCDAGKASAGFHLGVQQQIVEIAGFEVYTFGKNFDIRRLPRTQFNYAGRESDAPWRAAAEARIEKIRKGDLEVAVLDAAGRPVSGAKVEIAMKRHAFGWGSAVVAGRILKEDADSEKYREIIEKYFTRVVFENDLKWESWDNPANHEKILKAADWLRARNIEIRGHNLIWPSWRRTPPDLKGLAGEPEKLRQRINSHIESEVTAMKGRLVDWDVVNEPFSNNDVMTVLGNGEMIEWFKLAHQLDPGVKLYLNDFAILSGGGMDRGHQDHFEKTIRFLKESAAPIGGIGMQSHFGKTPTPPEIMLAILDRFAALGLPISITEHDIDTDDEQLQADFTRDFLTAVFSHPSICAVLTWGFWENSHWRPDAAYYRKDWSLRPAGQAWLDLVTKKWWTHLEAETGKDGTVRTCGFLGDYAITVTHDGMTKTMPMSLPAKGTKIEIRL